MTTYIATSPLLQPFHHEGLVPQLSQSPTRRNSLAGFAAASVGRGSFNDGGFNAYHPAGAYTHLSTYHPPISQPKHVIPRGHDSADVEAAQQEWEEVFAKQAAVGAEMTPEAAKGQDGATAQGSVGNAVVTAKTAELDPQGPFEGPEKLIELWFADCREMLPSGTLQASFTILQERQGRRLEEVVPKHRVGLRAVPRAAWEGMLDLVHCKVLSAVEGGDFDAYLLSESSMFVFSHKIILKTCGTTTLLLGLQRILELAKAAFTGSSVLAPAYAYPQSSEVGLQGKVSFEDAQAKTFRKLGGLVRRCFYSRKSFMFPERQKGPHRDWQLEVQLLDTFFANGSAYTVGKTNGDHWLLYMCCQDDKEDELMGELTVERPLRLPNPGCIDAANDQTLEILMTHLSSTSCAQFKFPADAKMPCVAEERWPAGAIKDRGHLLGMDLSAKLGLVDLYPNADLDAFAFEPCGYSANAIIPASDECSAGYWTIHVTPEDESSYASFESNVRLTKEPCRHSSKNVVGGIGSLVQRIVSIFEPRKLSITLFTSRREDGEAGNYDAEGNCLTDDVDVLNGLDLSGYNRRGRIAYELESYDLIFLHFESLVIINDIGSRRM